MNLRLLAAQARHPVRSIRKRRRERRERRKTLTDLERRRARARTVAAWRRRGTGALVVLGVLALVIGLPVLIWKGPFIFDGKYMTTTQLRAGAAALATGLRTSLVALVAAVGAGIALLYTVRTYRLTRRGQITDRFTKALERLGSDETYVRIGGILALEQIVQDAPDQAATDAARVLGHFIRDRAAEAHPKGGQRPASLPMKPAADVQAALTALTRSESRTHVDPREVLNLRGVHLAGADLRLADLTDARLEGATLTGADLGGATLTKAELTGTALTNAVLLAANLTEADLTEANLTAANLMAANLTETNLTGANLTAANLMVARLPGATLQGAKMTRAFLGGAKLMKANLTRANLAGSDMTGADLTDAHLVRVTLSRASLDRVTLTRTVLHETDLTSVKSLEPKQVSDAVVGETVLLPARFYPSVEPVQGWVRVRQALRAVRTRA
ncbi:pentapeptide repeat-containing protein [Streptomyces sp. N35]|uniref:pentapeptide repeat-containing protein n=1 Tax=Streptomyces sp. N35 TaxID=2795730 RepID=UPI0018F31B01|nr:pentapeptide repeat-containing protein [Streptomyces sp. N35]